MNKKMPRNPSDLYPTNRSMAEELKRLFPESFSPPRSYSFYTYRKEEKDNSDEDDENFEDCSETGFRWKENITEESRYRYCVDDSEVYRSPVVRIGNVQSTSYPFHQVQSSLLMENRNKMIFDEAVLHSSVKATAMSGAHMSMPSRAVPLHTSSTPSLPLPMRHDVSAVPMRRSISALSVRMSTVNLPVPMHGDSMLPVEMPTASLPLPMLPVEISTSNLPVPMHNFRGLPFDAQTPRTPISVHRSSSLLVERSITNTPASMHSSALHIQMSTMDTPIPILTARALPEAVEISNPSVPVPMDIASALSTQATSNIKRTSRKKH